MSSPRVYFYRYVCGRAVQNYISDKCGPYIVSEDSAIKKIIPLRARTRMTPVSVLSDSIMYVLQVRMI